MLSKLLPGTYVVSEVKAPDNYQADPTPQTVVVNAGAENPPGCSPWECSPL